MDAQFLAQRMMYLIPLVLSLSVHEFAHAWSAFRLGDDTAARMGRMTLNPMVHIDPLGTLLLPLLGIPFGWAKPVPVVPRRFHRGVNMGTGTVITAAAGPASNVVLAVLSAVVYGLLWRWAPDTLEQWPAVAQLAGVMIQMNIALALFNMLPIPPLDGSRVVEGLLPYRYRPYWERLTSLGPILLLVAVAAGGYLIAGPARFANHLVNQLLLSLAGGAA